MFQHIRAMHIDRINSPTTYIEHLNRRFIGNCDDSYHRSASEGHAHSMDAIKSEETSNSTKNDQHASNNERDGRNSQERNNLLASDHEQQSRHADNDIKQEDLPTDLSNKKPNSKSDADEDKRDVAYDKSNSNKENALNLYANARNHQRFEKQTKSSHDSSSQKTPDIESLQCSQCNAVLPNFEVFREHLKAHLTRGDLKNFVCFHCGMTFINQNEYEFHFSSHFLINTTEYNCTHGCNKSFDNSDALQKHLFELHAQNVWKCGICGELFESKVGIQIHLAMAHSNKEKSFRCSACMEVFETDADFKSHVRSQHSLMFSVPSLQCSMCRTICSSELEMHFHLATHARQYRCSMCPEAFHVKFLLDRHMQTHHCIAEKDPLPMPYKMDSINNNMFDYGYASFNASTGDSRAANAKKIYPFGSSFGSPSKLFNPLHIQTSATVPPLKITPPLYELYDNIGKSFYGDVAANKHLMNLYKAEYASKLFARSNPLVLLPPNSNDSHLSTLGDREQYFEKKNSAESHYVCSICDRNDFHSESEVQAHQKTNHNNKAGVSLRCAYCNDNFRSR